MSWFSLALSSAFSNSVVNVIDKIVVERYLRDRWSFPFFMAAFLGVYGVGLLAVRGALGLFRIPPAPVLAVALLPGTGLLLLNRDHRRLVLSALRAQGPVLLPGMAALELLAIAPLLLSTIAFALGPLGLVSAVRYTTPLFVLGMTGLLNGLRPGLVPEPGGRGHLLRRVLLTVGILAGVVMLRA